MSSPDEQPGGVFSQLRKDVASKSNLIMGPGSIVSNAAQSYRSKDQPPKLTGQDKSSVSMDSAYSSSMPGSSVSSEREQCDACTETAVKRCLSCMNSYCMTHVEDHYRSPELQKHQLEDLQCQAHCEQHHRRLELYCKTDQLPICSLCLLHDHRGHEVIEQNLQGAPILFREGVSPSIPSPGPIQFTSVQSDSVSLCWSPPEGSPDFNRFKVTWRGCQKQHSITVDDLDLELTELIPGEEYHIGVATLGKDGYQSSCVERSVRTEVPPPENLSVDLESLSASLTWTKPAGVDQVSYVLHIQRDQKHLNTIHRDSPHYTLPDLQYGEDYTIKVYTVFRNDRQSKPTSRTFTPEIPAPEHLTVNFVTTSSVSLSWKVSPEMKQIPHSFLVSYETEGTKPQSFSTESCSTDITSLKSGTEYTVRVYTELQCGRKSQSSSVHKRTEGVDLSDMLSALHLEQHRKEKLSLSSVLEISRNTLCDTAHRLDQLPHCFLRRLMMCKLDARKTKCQQLNSNDIMGAPNYSDAINPLDLITALFHCSDPFLQQEMVTKMAMCQFAVPLLLPNCDTQQSTLMLWAMRDIVKEFQLYSPAGDRTFVEGRIVEMAIPMISFVRLGVSGLAKSQTINQFLGNLHEHNTFVHCNMKCGDVPRKISDGLVELSWYLPSGIPSTDIFTQPVAIANLRGDGRQFKTLISFLCQTSAAVFIFNDDQYRDFTMLTGTEDKAELLLVTNSQRETFNRETLRDACKRHNIKDKNVIINSENDGGLVKKIQHIVSVLLKDNPKKTKLKDVAALACVEGFPVDEDKTDCKDGRQNAEQITDSISDVMKFKKTELPQSTQQDKSSLIGEELKQKQFQMDRSKAVVKFTNGFSHQRKERLYFLKWLQIHLDTLSRQNLSKLKQQYKECCRNTSQNKEQILQLDDQISNFLLGPEHFFRELGQLYESSYSFPENCSARQQVQHLPTLCAKVLIDGFPVELVDGDASIIPMQWISEVFTHLHEMVDSKSRILVLSVLGVQGTGKSTLLNTMFGTQFAVSSGRCTRGAFMQLIKVSEDFRSQPKCDFIMVIDTEGFKSPPVSKLDTSNKHNIKLATLVVGLSDITIFCVDMENSTEVKHFLQIVVQASLRMREVGKNPRCVFVHQNVPGWSACDKNKLVEQLNEMTQLAAKMEKKEVNTLFTDVMKYDPDRDSYYIPELWHGTPPMAPVSSGYSKAVSDLKNSLIRSLQSSVDITPIDATEFLMWTKILWDAVSYENDLNCRESLMAYVYTDLCTQYNSWEWSFQTDMNNWLITQETMIANFGVTDKNLQINLLRIKLKEILNEASVKLHAEERAILTNLDKYFLKKDNKVSSVVKYKEDFRKSVGSLKQELECALKVSLEKIIDIREGMEKVNAIEAKRNYIIKKKVCELLEDCKDRKERLSDNDLTTEFEKMWNEIIAELCDTMLPGLDVYKDVHYLLKSNLSAKSGHISEMINNADLRNCAHEEFIVSSDWFSDFISHGKRIVFALWHMKWNHFVAKTQRLCDKIIRECDYTSYHHVKTMKKYNIDYHDTYIKDILNDIDCQMKDYSITDKCEAYLKLHICSRVAKCFQDAHSEFIFHNAPKQRLMGWKSILLLKFLELYTEREHSQKKADIFTKACMKPAVQDYLSKHLGQAIANKIKTGDGVGYKRQEMWVWTPAHFQFALLKQLLHENSFEMYRAYTRSYETYAKNWINKQIVQEMLGGRMAQLEKKLISEIVRKVNHTITHTSKDRGIETFIIQFCSDLEDQLVFPSDALDTFLILINGKADQFANNLTDCMKEIEIALPQVYEGKEEITVRLKHLPSKPHELLFARLCGCGHQCPFCGAPCEAGGQKHSKHFSDMHRLQPFVRFTRDDKVTKLVVQISSCTTAVASDLRFASGERKGELHRCKDYRDIYPDWEIARKKDSSDMVSDYWKFMMMRFNEEFALAYGAEPADIPDQWKRLTSEDALRGLRRSFKIL